MRLATKTAQNFNLETFQRERKQYLQTEKSQKHNTFCVAIAPAQQACIQVVYELPSRIRQKVNSGPSVL